MNPEIPELPWLWAGSVLYVACAARAWAGAVAARPEPDRWTMRLLLAALAAVVAGIAVRWARLGHGPFFSMFEVLASGLFGLSVVTLFAWRAWPVLRSTAPMTLPVLAMMALWLPLTSPADTFFPPTYETPVLWFHVALGKLFLGFAFAGLGLAGLQLLRDRVRFRDRLPDRQAIDAMAWRIMQIALIFESLMLIAGAVWAQDAWGRWWAWDPLETWAFMTWLLLVGALHARRRWTIGPRLGAGLIVGVFLLAFLTFFGVPFVTVAPHKGAV
jgi:ABC-type transport system involved in cytochrome c biogenesis permease subunit